MKIKLTMASMHSERMIPLKYMYDKNVEFIINDPSHRKCDAWFVFDDYGPVDDVVGICPKENIFFVMGEAEHIQIYNRRFVQQFHNLITCQKVNYGVSNVIQDYYAGWFVGLKFGKHGLMQEYDYDYESFTSMKPLKKTKLISVVSSNKTMCDGHRQRLAFVEKLKNHFGDQLDVYGRGIKEFTDKWDVVSPYKYHIAIENQCQDYYVTEKLLDSYLSFSYPIYYGAPNAADIYPKESFSAIDIKDPYKSIETIERIISDDVYTKRMPAILDARHRVLNEQNFYVKVAKLAMTCPKDGVVRENIIRHEYDFTWKGRIKKFIHWGI